MSITCQVCGGAIPDGKERNRHTALCAEIALEGLRAQLIEIEQALEQLEYLDGEAELRAGVTNILARCR